MIRFTGTFGTLAAIQYRGEKSYQPRLGSNLDFCPCLSLCDQFYCSKGRTLDFLFASGGSVQLLAAVSSLDSDNPNVPYPLPITVQVGVDAEQLLHDQGGRHGAD